MQRRFSSTQKPSASGPRCTIWSVILRTISAPILASAATLYSPAIPHTSTPPHSAYHAEFRQANRRKHNFRGHERDERCLCHQPHFKNYKRKRDIGVIQTLRVSARPKKGVL